MYAIRSYYDIVAHLSAKLGVDVKMAPDCVGAEVKAMADALQMGEVMLLENLRFHNEEEKRNNFV